MKQLYVKKGLFENKEILVMNRNEDIEYNLILTPLASGAKVDIFNKQNQSVAVITASMVSSGISIDVTANGNAMAKIDFKKNRNMEYRDLVEMDDLTVINDWQSYKFELLRGYRKVAKVRPKWMEWGSTYELTIFEDEYTDAAIGMIVGMVLLDQLVDNPECLSVAVI
ncbi:hypothetical protein ACWOAH_03885 [Vagococcus vulneris]|uniref:Uncharacterized protein n=1 Tax=Vagococcus vulneris TaxID=1977869 RepID=A0A430A0N6_9ENTE|nr:hypothetical protein [Vagococcus vulneris]RST99874.1 hypothetical protein CBF37_03900 [Vagococcus vulneris]